MKKSFFTLFVCLPSLVLSAAQPMEPMGPSVAIPTSITWFQDGEAISVPSVEHNHKTLIPIDQMARIAGAQLSWQSVTEQACLSKVQGQMCFNWGDSAITRDGRKIKASYPLRFEDNQLLVPVEFAASKDFSSFSKSRIQWDKAKKELSQTSPLNLTSPQVEKMDDRYRVTIHMPVVVPHYLLEKSDDRIWIRFVRANSEGSVIYEGDQVLKEIKMLQKRHSADVMLSPGPLAASHEVFFDPEEKDVIIDIFTQPGVPGPQAQSVVENKPKPAVKKVAKGKFPIPAKVMPVKTVSVPATVASVGTKKGIRTIVIDAGHGGMDSGAIGIRGTMEKDINLEAAKLLARQLAQNKNFKVILTRNKDEFITLAQRTQIANDAKADLFISVHCNSSLSPKGIGFEAYVLSPDATDKAAEAVARVENSVVSLEAKKGARSSKLEELLASMAVYNFINESSKFAAHVCRSLKSRSVNERAYVKEADFYVLRGAQMPALLLELEYLSNPISEMKLRSSRYRNQIAKGVTEAVNAYHRQVVKESQALASQSPVDNQEN